MSEALESRWQDRALDESLDSLSGEAVPPRRKYDRRKHERRQLNTLVRFMVIDRFEDQGELLDISPDGFRIGGSKLPNIGDTVVAYMDEIGRFEGRVVRHEEGAFAVKMSLTTPKLARLERSIEAFFAREDIESDLSDRRGKISDRRQHERRTVDLDFIDGARANNEVFRCSVANISFSGIEIITTQSLNIGETVKIGVVQGVVTRKTEKGYAIARAG